MLGNADTFLIGYFMDSSAISVYDITYTLGKTLTIALSSVTFLAVPLFSDIHSRDEDDELRDLFQLVTKWVVFVTLPLFFLMFLFPKEVIALSFGIEYAGGSLALRIVALGFFLSVLVGNVQDALTATDRTKSIMYGSVVAAIANLGLNYLLIPIYGIVGAAISTAAMYVLLNLLLLVVLYRETGIQPFSKSMVLPLLAVVPVILGLNYWVELDVLQPVLFVMFALLFGFVYVTAILTMGGVGFEELMIVNSIEQKYDINMRFPRGIIYRFSG